ncbi:MAG: hypothetical protein EPO31_08915 [Gammaproteobacteria bacterium]|nr:MAG: hypothetical protein EPO31_08915 [Gammaproteobacteria bacterium]
MSARRKIKYIHEGHYVAEIAIAVTESEQGWSPTISLEDAYKLDDAREALKAGNLKAAAQYGRVYEFRPVVSVQ